MSVVILGCALVFWWWLSTQPQQKLGKTCKEHWTWLFSNPRSLLPVRLL